MNWKRFVLIALFTPLVMHCDQVANSGSGDKATVLKDLANQFALGTFEKFHGATETLVASTEEFCQSPVPEKLEAARTQWRAARALQKRFEIIQFGPIKEYPLRLGPLLDTWPVNEDAILDLFGEETDLSQTAFSQRGSKHRGMPVVEFLLWGGDPDGMEAFQENPRRCEVLLAVATDLVSNSERLVEAWREDWIPQLTGEVPGEKYKSAEEALDEWVNRMGFTVENIRINKLEKPSGFPDTGKPKPDILESPYSDHSLEDAKLALEGVIAVWEGDPAAGTLGVSALVNSLSLRLNMSDALANAMASLQEIPAPLSKTIEGEFPSLQKAREALKNLQSIIQGDVVSQVGVKLSFNDGDGD